MVRILGFHCHGLGLVPGPRTEIPQAVQHNQKAKKKKKKLEGEKAVAHDGLFSL